MPDQSLIKRWGWEDLGDGVWFHQESGAYGHWQNDNTFINEKENKQFNLNTQEVSDLPKRRTPPSQGNPPTTTVNPTEEGGVAISTTDIGLDGARQFITDAINFGVGAALYRYGQTNDDLEGILEKAGLSEEQSRLLQESEEFRNGIQEGEVPSPQLRSALEDIEELDTYLTGILDDQGRTDRTHLLAGRSQDLIDTAGFGRMPNLLGGTRTAREIVETGGRTPTTRDLYRQGRELVVERGFTPEFRQAWDQLLALTTSDATGGGAGPGSILHPAFAALNKIIESGGAEGSGLLPLNEIVGLAQAQAGQRSVQIVKAAQQEAARRGLSGGAVTTGTGVLGEAAQLQLGQEGQALTSVILGHQTLRSKAVSDALRNLVSLAEIQRNDPVTLSRTNALGDLIRATTTNIQTGAQLGLGAQRAENERLGIGFQSLRDLSAIAAERERGAFQTLLGVEGAEQSNRDRAVRGLTQGNQIQSNIGMGLQQQMLQSMGLSAGVAQSGQQNFLNAINQHQQLGSEFMRFGQTGLAALPGLYSDRAPWWQGLVNAGLGAAAGAAGGALVDILFPGRNGGGGGGPGAGGGGGTNNGGQQTGADSSVTYQGNPWYSPGGTFDFGNPFSGEGVWPNQYGGFGSLGGFNPFRWMNAFGGGGSPPDRRVPDEV